MQKEEIKSKGFTLEGDETLYLLSILGMKEKASLRIIRMWSANYNEIQGGFFNMSQYTDDLHSLSHTKWNCKYHVVFAPKYRRKAFYEARGLEIGKIVRDL